MNLMTWIMIAPIPLAALAALYQPVRDLLGYREKKAQARTYESLRLPLRIRDRIELLPRAVRMGMYRRAGPLEKLVAFILAPLRGGVDHRARAYARKMVGRAFGTFVDSYLKGKIRWWRWGFCLNLHVLRQIGLEVRKGWNAKAHRDSDLLDPERGMTQGAAPIYFLEVQD